MASYDSLQSPSKLFVHSRHLGNVTTTAPKRSLKREFSFKSPERRLNFDIIPGSLNSGSNDRIEYTTSLVDKGRRVAELENKIQLVLSNNRELVDENQEMKSMLMIQRSEIDQLRVRRSRGLDLALTEQLEAKNYEHRVEVEKLLSEITRLQEEFMFGENAKDMEIVAIRDQLERANMLNVDSLRRSQDGISQAYEMQIRKMGDVIQFKEEDIARLLITHRRDKEILLEELAALRSELRHLSALKNVEINELKSGYEAELERLQRESRQKEETQNQAHDAVLKRMNRQLGQRLGDIERLTDQLRNSNLEHSELYKQLDSEKKRFEDELESQAQGAKDRIRQEKQKMDNLISRALQNTRDQYEGKARVQEDEITLLKQLLENRRGDLETQRETLVTQRDSYRIEIGKLEKENAELRQRLEEVARENLSSLEALKVKMGVLHEANVNGLAKIHETRLAALSEELIEKGKQYELMNTRMHQELQAKMHIRKQYELETSRLKSKVMDLRIQLNAVQVEMKDNITSMKSQLDVTSQGLIKDRETKARALKSSQDEMRKLRQTIDAKDQQLKLVEDNARSKEQYYKNLWESESDKVLNLKRELEEREKRKAKELLARDEEIGRLKKTIEELKELLVQEESLRKKRSKEADEEVAAAEQKTKQAQKEAQLLREKITSLEHDLNLTRGDVETVRFEQQAAANQERGKNQESIGRAQSGFKEYYQVRVKVLQKDKQELQDINSIQCKQINQLVVKYKQLQDGLKGMLQSQRKLSDLEVKIVNIGMDNNLVNNVSELVKRPFH